MAITDCLEHWFLTFGSKPKIGSHADMSESLKVSIKFEYKCILCLDKLVTVDEEGLCD
jgi:hypothetical protein